MGRLKELRNYINGEISKIDDADVISHTMNDPSKSIKENEQDRYNNICKEFGFT